MLHPWIGRVYGSVHWFPHLADKDFTPSLLRITLLAGCGSLNCGFNLWIVYSPSVIMQDFYNISFTEFIQLKGDKNYNNFLTGLTIALFPLGGTVGSVVVSRLTDEYGRKMALLANCVFAVIAAILVACSMVVEGYEFTMVSRLANGICSGIFYTAVPIYLSEISPTNLRGSILLVPHLFIVIGVLVAQILALRELLGNQEGWPILKSILGMVALCQGIGLLMCPESPRYLLIQKKNEEKAREVLKKLRNKENVEDEIEELNQEDAAEIEEKGMNPLKLLSFPNQRQQTINACALACSQQLVGITAAYQHTEKIYAATKIGLDNVRFMSIFTSIIVLVIVIVLMYVIIFVERKVLLIIGLVICGFCSLLLIVSTAFQEKFLSMAYIGTITVNLFLFAHAIGPSSIPNVLTAEMFLQSSRSSGYVIQGFVHWLIYFIGSVAYLLVAAKLKGYIFIFFIPFNIAGIIYSFKFLPETNNKTFLEIRRESQKTEEKNSIVT